MRAPTLGGKSRLGGIAIVTALIVGMLPLFAFGVVTIEDEGSGCIKLDDVDKIVQGDFPFDIDFGDGVVLTVTGGTEKPGEEGDGEWMTLDYTVSGLTGDQMITWKVYVGQNETASGNSSPVTQQGNAAISHVIFCLTGTPTTTSSVADSSTTSSSMPSTTSSSMVDSTTSSMATSTTSSQPTTTSTSAPTTTSTSAPTTTSTSAPTTTSTTIEATTTSTEATTTTTEATTTTTEATTTTCEDAEYALANPDECDEVLPTVVTTTTVSDPDLPLTGARADVLFGIAVVMTALGLLTLTFTRRLED